ncbi:hypothetical protein ABK040_007509 [Willaertia magna]
MTDFTLCPNFAITNMHLLLQIEVPDEAKHDWEVQKEINLLISSLKDSACTYFLAKRRYITLMPFLTKRPWPLLYLVLAEAHFWLRAYHDSLELLIKLRECILPDEKLENIINNISKIINVEEEQDEEYHRKQGATLTCSFETPFSCPVVMIDQEPIDRLKNQWEQIQNKEKEANEQFIRHACIATNVIENVFELEENCWYGLVRRGFYMNSIEGIPQNSKQKKKETIIQILDNTQECLKYISKCLDNYNEFTSEFIKLIHRTLLKNDNFDEYTEDGCTIYRLITTGKFRKLACITSHNNEITQYCHHSKIEKEMELYCERARNILNNEKIDPFMKAAWLQWAFLRIHPFEDGNGRVSRIISSIPLSKINLPPIVVTSANKKEYFKTLHSADREQTLRPLSEFLQKTLFIAMTEIENLPSEETLRVSRVRIPIIESRMSRLIKKNVAM